MAKRTPYLRADATIRMSIRTLKQWRHSCRVGKLLGLKQDQVLARALYLGLKSMRHECDRLGIDWRSVTDDARSDQAIRRELGESPPARPMPDTGHPDDYVPPMIDD